MTSLLQLLGPGYADETLAQHVLASMQLVLTGFIAAAITGLPLGLLMGLSRPANFFFNGIFQIMRPIAPIAWIPLTILWFGLGATAKVFVIWLAAFAPVVINTQTGVRNVEPVLIAAARVHGALGRTILFDIVIPGALPTIFTGLRISLAGLLDGASGGRTGRLLRRARSHHDHRHPRSESRHDRGRDGRRGHAGRAVHRGSVLSRAAGDPVAAMTTILRDDGSGHRR